MDNSSKTTEKDIIVQPQPSPVLNAPLDMPVLHQPTKSIDSEPKGDDDRSARLEHLANIGMIRFREKARAVNQISCLPIELELVNENEQILYQMQERSDRLVRNCLPRGLRTSTIVSDSNNAQVLTFRREARCVCSCCLPCCCYPLPASRERLSVFAGGEGGDLLGTVRQDWSAREPYFSVLDANDDCVLTIKAPGYTTCVCENDIDFKILSLDGTHVGTIAKHDNGIRKVVTIKFPQDMDFGMKATLLGAVYLINFIFFQGAARRPIFSKDFKNSTPQNENEMFTCLVFLCFKL